MNYRFVLYQGGAIVSEFALLARTSVVLGRDSRADIRIDDRKASRRHCRITNDERGLYLIDLGSRNGTRVDGSLIQSACTAGVGACAAADAGANSTLFEDSGRAAPYGGEEIELSHGAEVRIGNTRIVVIHQGWDFA